MTYKTLPNKTRVAKTKVGLRDYYFVRNLKVKGAYDRGAFVVNRDGSVKLFKTQQSAISASKRKFK